MARRVLITLVVLACTVRIALALDTPGAHPEEVPTQPFGQVSPEGEGALSTGEGPGSEAPPADDADDEAARIQVDYVREATALFLMALILVLVVVLVMVFTLARRLVFAGTQKRRPTELEDLWWKMNADVGPFPESGKGPPPEPDGEDKETGDEAYRD